MQNTHLTGLSKRIKISINGSDVFGRVIGGFKKDVMTLFLYKMYFKLFPYHVSADTIKTSSVAGYSEIMLAIDLITLHTIPRATFNPIQSIK